MPPRPRPVSRVEHHSRAVASVAWPIMADLADHAYAHATAVLSPGEVAVEVAVQALRRGGRTLPSVLGHVRHRALQAAERCDGGVERAPPAPQDLTELALALAASRPPLERAVVDLDTRHGLDRSGFARALGLPPAAAAARAAAVYLDWQRHLDPVVLARLGPGDCDAVDEALRDAGLGGRGEVDLGSLLSAGEAVAEHATACSTCRDRLRAMVSVRLLLAQRPMEAAPDPVRAAASPSLVLRLQSRPTPPPPLEAGDRRRDLVRTALLATAAIGAVATGTALVAGLEPRQEARVESLTRLPPPTPELQVQPTSLHGVLPQTVELHNASGRSLSWQAEPDVPWLELSPASGRLEPGRSALMRLALQAAPEGELRAVVRVSATNGSATVVRLAASVEHPPDIAASVRGCEVLATVEDEGVVVSVALHWAEPSRGTGSVAMHPSGHAFSGRLPEGGEGLKWWVSAADARGNASRSSELALPAGTCP